MVALNALRQSRPIPNCENPAQWVDPSTFFGTRGERPVTFLRHSSKLSCL
jgi:hypothetical protein